MADASKYTDLITSEHADKPKFQAVVAAVCEPLSSAQAILRSFIDAFGLETAVGVQLDAVGAWVGIPRTLAAPLSGVYFSFDDPVLGFDQGVWKGPFDPSAGLVSLSDDDYRLVIRAKIGANSWDGTLVDAIRVLNIIFDNTSKVYSSPVETDSGEAVTANQNSQPKQVVVGYDDGTYVMIEDHDDMSISFVMAGTIPSPVVQALFSSGYITLKPEAVLVDGYYKTSMQGSPIFGFDISNEYIAGFDVGAWPEKI